MAEPVEVPKVDWYYSETEDTNDGKPWSEMDLGDFIEVEPRRKRKATTSPQEPQQKRPVGRPRFTDIRAEDQQSLVLYIQPSPSQASVNPTPSINE